MNKSQLKADLIKLGIADEEETIVINTFKHITDSCYILIIGGTDDLKTFYFQNNKLCHIGGNCVTPDDVDIMRKLDIEEY